MYYSRVSTEPTPSGMEDDSTLNTALKKELLDKQDTPGYSKMQVLIIVV